MITATKIIIYSLSAVFAISGLIKFSKDKKKLSKSLPWVKDFKPVTIKFIGFLEIFAAIGLVGPGFIGFAYQITSYTAIGLCILMILAGIYHSRKHQYYAFAINVILFALSAYLAFN